MTTNMYAVIKRNGTSRTMVLFDNKEKAQAHAETLDCFNAKEYIVVPSEVTLFMPVRD